MKNALTLIGLGMILIACDQSIESRLQKSGAENVANVESLENRQQESVANTAEKVKEEPLQAVVNAQENTKIEASSQDEVEQPKEAANKDKPTEVIEENVNVKKSEPQESTSEITKPVETVKEKVEPVKPALKAEVEKQATKKLNEQTTSSNKKDVVNKVSGKAEKGDKTTKAKSRVETTAAVKNSKSNDRKAEPTVEKRTNAAPKETKATVKNTKSSKSDGTYDENGNLISNFTEEELRVGAQRNLTKDEIQYYKSLCRYAYMSDQDVIDNHCETKKISFTKRNYAK